jgi:outer membrane protein assembly factor BamB
VVRSTDVSDVGAPITSSSSPGPPERVAPNLIVPVRFRKKRVAPLKRYGSYRGQGTLRLDGDGIWIDGRHVFPAGLRIAGAIVISLMVFFLTRGLVVVGAVPLYFLVEYVFLAEERIHVRWPGVRAMGFDPAQDIVAIDFDGPRTVSPVAFSTSDARAVAEIIQRHGSALSAVESGEGSAKGTSRAVIVLATILVIGSVGGSILLSVRLAQRRSSAGLVVSHRPSTEASPSPEPPRTDTPSAPITRGPDATSYQVNPLHNGNASGAQLRSQPRRAWARSWRGTVSYPLIAQGRVFVTVTDPDAKVEAEAAREIVALNARTGETLWTFDAGASWGSLTLAYDGSRLFAIDQDGSIDGLSARAGVPLWNTEVETEYGIDSPAVAWDGRLYVATSDHRVIAIDGATGDILWDELNDGGTAHFPTLLGSGVIVADVCLNVAGHATVDGSLIWTYRSGCTGGGDGASISAHGGKVYARGFTGPGIGIILDARSGRKVGSFRASASPAFSGRVGYFPRGRTLRARSLPGMEVLWRFQGDSALTYPPIVVGRSVFIASARGVLYELDATGRVVVRSDLGAHLLDPNYRELTGMNAGDGILAVAASNRLIVFR